MRKSKRIAISCISILILLVGLLGAILDAANVIDVKGHPILTFLFLITCCYAVLWLFFAVKKGSPFLFFLSALLLNFPIIYLFILLALNLWYIGLLVVFVVDTIVAIISFMIAGNRTEDIALNNKADYKSYKEREKEEEPEEEKPELKSFKD